MYYPFLRCFLTTILLFPSCPLSAAAFLLFLKITVLFLLFPQQNNNHHHAHQKLEDFEGGG